MYSKTLIAELMRVKNYAQYKQVAAELGFSTAYIARVNTGKEEFTEETAIYIAMECGLDPQEVVMRLAEARAKTQKAKNIWTQVLKRYCAGAEAAVCAGLLALAYPGSDFALCRSYVKY